MTGPSTRSSSRKSTPVGDETGERQDDGAVGPGGGGVRSNDQIRIRELENQLMIMTAKLQAQDALGPAPGPSGLNLGQDQISNNTASTTLVNPPIATPPPVSTGTTTFLPTTTTATTQLPPVGTTLPSFTTPQYVPAQVGPANFISYAPTASHRLPTSDNRLYQASLMVEKIPKVGTMPLFSGQEKTRDGQAAVCLMQFDHALRRHGHILDDIGLYVLAMKYLRDAAEEVLTHPGLKTNPSWDYLKLLLQDKFPDMVEGSACLFATNRRPGQSVGDHMVSVSQHIAYLSAPEQKSLLLRKFQTSLPKGAYFIYKNNPQLTLYEAIDQIEAYLEDNPSLGLSSAQISKEREAARFRPRVAQASAQENIQGLPQTPYPTHHTPSRGRTWRPHRQHPFKYRFQCFNCKGMGHKARECPSILVSPPKNEETGRQVDRGRADTTIPSRTPLKTAAQTTSRLESLSSAHQ